MLRLASDGLEGLLLRRLRWIVECERPKATSEQRGDRLEQVPVDSVQLSVDGTDAHQVRRRGDAEANTDFATEIINLGPWTLAEQDFNVALARVEGVGRATSSDDLLSRDEYDFTHDLYQIGTEKRTLPHPPGRSLNGRLGSGWGPGGDIYVVSLE